MLKGIDASSVQGVLPFDRYKPDFLIHKAKQGNDGFDPMFHKNVAAAEAAGIPSLAYFFSYPLPHLDPVAQAKGFYESIRGTIVDGRPPCIDLEWPAPEDWAQRKCNGPQIAAWCEKHMEAVEEAFQRTPVIYTYPWWWKSIGEPSWASRYPLWIASYQAKALIPKPWTSALIHQYDGNGGERLPNGVDADFNYFNGTAEDFRRFIDAPVREPLAFDIVHPKVIE
jgi:lysozyme